MNVLPVMAAPNRTMVAASGGGIAPDIAVDPAQALIVALETSGVSHEQAVALNSAEIPAEPVHRDKLRSR